MLIVITIAVIALEASLAIVLLSPVEEDVKHFLDNVAQQCSYNAYCKVKEVAHYIDTKLGWSWNNPMSALEIDNMLSPLDYKLLSMLGFSQSHVILWQGWGSCGQHAVVTAYLLHRLGYTVRIAYFTDIDHAWAEVHINGSWYIVDPWYIGLIFEDKYHGSRYLAPASILATLKNFSGSHTVMCRYFNGSQIDCTGEHGYR